MRTVFFLVLLFLYFPGCSESKREITFHAESELDTNRVAIGDVFRYTITASAPYNKFLRFQEMTDDDALEIRRFNSREDASGMKTIEFELALWDTGQYTFPPYAVEIFNSDSTLDQVVMMDSLSVFVFSSIAEDSLFRASGKVDLKPVKSPVPIDTPLPYRTLVLGAAFLILLALIIFIWFRRTPDRFRFAEPFLDVQPPDAVALGKLKDLSKLIDENSTSIKEYYTSLSHILREYIEFAFFVKTLEMTTEEIEMHANDLPFGSSRNYEWKEVLKQADMVKYAKEMTTTETIRKDIASAEAFIKNTTIFWKRTDPSLP